MNTKLLDISNFNEETMKNLHTKFQRNSVKNEELICNSCDTKKLYIHLKEAYLSNNSEPEPL